jgi:hypothetical protein
VNQRGDIVLGWLVKLIVSLAIVGVVAFEGGAVVVAHVGADSAANDASGEAAISYSHRHDLDAAKEAAEESARMSGARVVGFVIAADGKAVIVTVEKKAHTIILQRLGATRSWSTAQATARRAVPD